MSFFVCNCFYTNNVFIKNFNVHVTYHNREHFDKFYKKILRERGCVSQDQYEEVMNEIQTEIQRRRNLGEDCIRRTEEIRKNYVPLHRDIYHLKEAYLSPVFLELVNLADRVYTFPIFSKEFCALFMEEIANFEESSCPKGRPNTMNKYGVLLNEIGFDENFLIPLRENYISHITKHLFLDWGGDCLDSHKAFVVKYKIGEDLDLNYHYDNAEVTINVSLGREFSGGSLFFGDVHLDPSVKVKDYVEYSHKPTVALLHRGLHKHGANPITNGERYNLIIWMRSSKVRNKMCPMCNQRPHLVASVGFGDGFTQDHQETIDICTI